MEGRCEALSRGSLQPATLYSSPTRDPFMPCARAGPQPGKSMGSWTVFAGPEPCAARVRRCWKASKARPRAVQAPTLKVERNSGVSGAEEAVTVTAVFSSCSLSRQAFARLRPTSACAQPAHRCTLQPQPFPQRRHASAMLHAGADARPGPRAQHAFAKFGNSNPLWCCHAPILHPGTICTCTAGAQM